MATLLSCTAADTSCGSGCDETLWASLIAPGAFNASQASLMCSTASYAVDSASAATSTLSGTVFGIQEGLNCMFLVVNAALVFVMHAGFAMLCAGAIRSKNTMNILLQTIMDAAVSAIAFYLIGFGIAYGGYTPFVSPTVVDYQVPANGFIGTAMFALSDMRNKNPNNGQANGDGIPTSTHWQDWVYQWAFSATATTIPAGCVAERFNFNAYLGYSFFIAGWVYPIVAHWSWSLYGWMGYARAGGLTHLFGAGFIDFAGSGVVHMVGGISGMWGCILVGPRMGRFDSNGKPVDMPGHSATLVVLGTVLLWFGWYGFNPGSTILISNANLAMISGRAAVTTTLSGAAGGIMGLTLSFIRHKAWDLVAVCNGVLCGFVAITAGAHVLEPWAAIIDGAIATLVFEGVCWLFLRLKIDDPLCAAPMHGFAGMWGLLFVGLLARKEYILQLYGGSHLEKGCWAALGAPTEIMQDGVMVPCDNTANYPYGLFYPGGGGRLLASQVIGILVIFGWVTANMVPFFYIFKFFGMLRISAEEEQAGLDVSKHGGSAYNYDHGLNKPDKAPGL